MFSKLYGSGKIIRVGSTFATHGKLYIKAIIKDLITNTQLPVIFWRDSTNAKKLKLVKVGSLIEFEAIVKTIKSKKTLNQESVKLYSYKFATFNFSNQSTEGQLNTITNEALHQAFNLAELNVTHENNN